MEECLSYTREEPQGDVHKFADLCTEHFVHQSPAAPESIITINEIPERLVPGYLASGLAIVIYESLENAFLHAFSADSPANYIHLQVKAGWNPENQQDIYTLSISDSGCGASEDLFDNATPESGAAAVNAVVKMYDGSLELTITNGTAIKVVLKESLDSANYLRPDTISRAPGPGCGARVYALLSSPG